MDNQTYFDIHISIISNDIFAWIMMKYAVPQLFYDYYRLELMEWKIGLNCNYIKHVQQTT